ncbi:MAG: hypothetical protein V4719_06215 [Planctomycetota bacterium]
MRHLPSLVCCCSLGLGMLIGCGPSGPRRDYAEVKGKVTYQGESLKKGTVIFQPASGAAVVADIQPNGTYTLKGVIGPNSVMVSNREPDPGPGGATPEQRKAAKAAAAAAAKVKVVPPIYGTPASPLKVVVKAGANTADWEIK